MQQTRETCLHEDRVWGSCSGHLHGGQRGLRGDRPPGTLGACDPGLYLRNRVPSRFKCPLRDLERPDSLQGRKAQGQSGREETGDWFGTDSQPSLSSLSGQEHTRARKNLQGQAGRGRWKGGGHPCLMATEPQPASEMGNSPICVGGNGRNWNH